VQSDLEERRAVPRAKAEAWCKDNGDMAHFSVSAKDGENVEQAFHVLAKQAKRKLEIEYALLHHPLLCFALSLSLSCSRSFTDPFD
jgi:hypothetical protein